MLAVNWMRNKDIAMIHLHYFSSPLLHPHPDLFSAGHMLSNPLSLLFSCLALMVVLWCYVWNLPSTWGEREHLFPCWMTAVQGRFGDSAALPENEASPPDNIQTGMFRAALRGAAVLTRCMSWPIRLCMIICPVECCCVFHMLTNTHAHTR